jgi:hypothetical protein
MRRLGPNRTASQLSSCAPMQAAVSRSHLTIRLAKFRANRRYARTMWLSMPTECRYRLEQFTHSIQSVNHSNDGDVCRIAKPSFRKAPPRTSGLEGLLSAQVSAAPFCSAVRPSRFCTSVKIVARSAAREPSLQELFDRPRPDAFRATMRGPVSSDQFQSFATMLLRHRVYEARDDVHGRAGRQTHR